MSEKGQLKKWQELPPGGVVIKGGNAAEYGTGTWRTRKPVWKSDNCIECLTCWVLCPVGAFILKDGKTASGDDRKEIQEINYFHCKGCGLCVKECPVNKEGKKEAIEFIRQEP